MKKLIYLLVAAVLVSGSIYIEDINKTEAGIMVDFIDGTGYWFEF